MIRRTPIRKVSKKRAAQLREYSKLRKVFMEHHPICEVCGHATATDIHHRDGRTGERLNDVNYFLAVCRSCHHDIHASPAWAGVEGYLL